MARNPIFFGGLFIHYSCSFSSWLRPLLFLIVFLSNLPFVTAMGPPDAPFNLIVVGQSFDFSISNSGDMSINGSSSVTNTISTSLVSGSSQPVFFLASGFPTGVTHSFTQASCAPSCSSNLTITTTSATPAGTYPITVTAAGGGLTKTTVFNLVIQAPFDFALTNGGTVTMWQPGSPYTIISTTLVSGSSQPVSFSASGFPAGVTPSFSQTSCSPSCSSNLTITTTSATPAGSYPITVTAVGGAATRTTAFTLIVNNVPSFDFTLSNSGDKTVDGGSSVVNTIMVSVASGAAQAVSFSTSGLPSGANGLFSSGSCTPNCSSVLSINTTGLTPAGSFPIIVTASGGGVTKTTTFLLTVVLNVAMPTISPNGGSFSNAVSVTLATATPGASIYYSMDGSAPTLSSSLYTAAMALNSDLVIRARAFRSGYTQSAENSATFAFAGSSSGNTFYIAPNGSDSNAGTYSQPWKTWANSFQRLNAGDTLIAKDGTYNGAQGNGYPNINCAAGQPYKNGTSTQLITVRAENERQAFIDSNGSTYRSFWMQNCSYWKIEGLRIKSDDFNDGTIDGGDVMVIASSNNITLRRLILYKSNRYRNSHILRLSSTNNSLVEENEIYWFHRHGIIISTGSNNNIRRNYANSRDYTDLPGASTSSPPYQSVDSARGDTCFIGYPGTNNIFENNICEKASAGYEVIAASSNVINNRFFGNIANEVIDGFLATAQDPFTNQYPTSTHLTDLVVVDASRGFNVYGIDQKCTNCTFINMSAGGVFARRSSSHPFTSSSSVNCINCLAVNGLGAGFFINTPDWGAYALEYPWAYGNSAYFSPPAGASITNKNTSDPKMGSCRVWQPDGSPTLNAGKNGAHVGARVLYIYLNGVLQAALPANRLWDTTTGAWRWGGANVPAVNDVAGASLSDVHTRLRINNGGCNFPAGY